MSKPKVRSNFLIDITDYIAYLDMSQQCHVFTSFLQLCLLDRMCVSVCCLCLTVLLFIYFFALTRGGDRHLVSGGENLGTAGSSA